MELCITNSPLSTLHSQLIKIPINRRAAENASFNVERSSQAYCFLYAVSAARPLMGISCKLSVKNARSREIVPISRFLTDN